MTPQGMPSASLEDFHGGLADGGIAMTTLAYCAIENDGRLHEDMIYMGEHVREQLSALIEKLHARGCKVSGQMGHGGGFSQNTQLSKKRPLGPSFGLNALGIAKGMFFCDAMKQQDIDNLIQAYAKAATFMKSVGFDCLEIHFGHGYGLCQFISPKTNKRKDQYGGSLENRMRLPLAVLAAVREAVGADFPILGKISLTEGVRGGLDYDDAVDISKMLDAGGIDGIITSGGTSTMNPMIMFRGDNILPSMLKYEKSRLMRLILRLAGPVMFKRYAYEELYFLPYALKVKQAVRCKMIYVGGASTNASFATLMQHGFDFIQLGRSLLANPNLPQEAELEADYASRCTHCNMCIGTIGADNGIFCPLYNNK
jgi:2,4-dienoyl-CoA reductase-like NADH-dependent reductase (Old Yellow Enzyme family)